MPRTARIDVGGYVYHVLNRANARVQIFDNDDDYIQFEEILEEAVERFSMRLLAYCIMPNHWHLVLYPRNDGDLAAFTGWLSNTHTRRWHTAKETVGQGHLYQGRYKSFLCQKNNYLLTLLRYVERNAKRANLVQQAEEWRWSSVWRRAYGSPQQQRILSAWPIDVPRNYLDFLNKPQTAAEEEALERSNEKGMPYGEESWARRMVNRFGLGQTLRGVGRPRRAR